jgi:hypothetical protein
MSPEMRNLLPPVEVWTISPLQTDEPGPQDVILWTPVADVVPVYERDTRARILRLRARSFEQQQSRVRSCLDASRSVTKRPLDRVKGEDEPREPLRPCGRRRA